MGNTLPRLLRVTLLIFHPSDSEISDCLPRHRAVCVPARVRRAEGAESAEESVSNGRQLSHQGRVMGPPPLSPPARPRCAWLLLLWGRRTALCRGPPQATGPCLPRPGRVSLKTPPRHFTRTKTSKQAESALLGGTTPWHRGARAEREVTCPKATQ